MRDWNFTIGGFVVGGIAVLGIFSPWIAPFDPLQITLANELCKPSLPHPMGCDANGTDIFSILLHGARISLEVGVSVTLFSVFIGLIFGSIAGYFGGWRDALLMRILDIIFAFPGILLAIAMASMLGPSKRNLIICLVLTSWAGYARLVRGEVLALKSIEFIEAARALGAKKRRIFLYHLWPNLLTPLLVSATFGIGGTVLSEASLSFLGIGMPPGTPSWGSLLSFGRDVLLEAPHVAAFPGLMIIITVLGFHLLGEGIRKRFDPKSANRR
jgi:peptide/nickel transport system permease protein